MPHEAFMSQYISGARSIGPNTATALYINITVKVSMQ